MALPTLCSQLKKKKKPVLISEASSHPDPPPQLRADSGHREGGPRSYPAVCLGREGSQSLARSPPSPQVENRRNICVVSGDCARKPPAGKARPGGTLS